MAYFQRHEPFERIYSLYSLLSKFDILSSENGGMRQSKFMPSSRSIRKVPLKTNKNEHYFVYFLYVIQNLTTYDHLAPVNLYDLNIEKLALLNLKLALAQQLLYLVQFLMSQTEQIFSSVFHAAVHSIDQNFPNECYIATNELAFGVFVYCPSETFEL